MDVAYILSRCGYVGGPTYLDFKTSSIATSFFTLRLTIATPCFNVPDSQIKRLQHVSNFLARTATMAPNLFLCSFNFNPLTGTKLKNTSTTNFPPWRIKHSLLVNLHTSIISRQFSALTVVVCHLSSLLLTRLHPALLESKQLFDTHHPVSGTISVSHMPVHRPLHFLYLSLRHFFIPGLKPIFSQVLSTHEILRIASRKLPVPLLNGF